MEHASDEERGSTNPSAVALPAESASLPSSYTDDESQQRLDPTTTLIAESLSTGVSVSNGTVFPPAAATLEQALSRKPDRPISGVVPPYWRHQRNFSRASLASADTARSSKPAITLEDHTDDPDSATTRGLWAKSVRIDEHVVVSGRTGVGAYVVWMCNVQTLDGGPMMIRLRYSQFDELRDLLSRAFPHAKHALPPLPPKSALFKFRPKFLEARRLGLQYFLNCVLLNPEFSGSPVLKDYLFSHIN
ncbi:Phox homologous domain-containing protein [Talaromyces proteolyticus]|uniref:Endosomal/vacuolar adapter protein YPT35 n=1 Tax=Talaromyces proteolyticus TaxID=1131652 RepID=A0AAD4PSJ2_9EURO|nr:Phox homologous domain-containing protein [Talaromyces proteolyticus]KAH8689086.1 Phox homologous domain-containing protein [Talaromyces proteolyticus]